MRVSLCTPISHIFADRSAATSVRQASDALELRPEFMNLAPSVDLAPTTHAHISSFHCDLNLPWTHEVRTELKAILEAAPKSLRMVTFHVSRDVKEAVIDSKGRFKSVGAPMAREEMLENCIDNVQWLRRQFPGLSFAVENNNFYDTGAYDLATDPTFISEVCEAAEIGLLLDVAHARVSAGNLGIALQDYVDGLPINRVVQLHVSRPGVRDTGEWFDAHECPSVTDVVNAVSLTSFDGPEPLPLTIEYYRSATQLVECLVKIRDGLNRC